MRSAIPSPVCLQGGDEGQIFLRPLASSELLGKLGVQKFAKQIFGEVAERSFFAKRKMSSRNEVTRTLNVDSWFLYIIECRTKEFYVGICKNVEERVKLHNYGRACRYTKYRTPVVLRYSECCCTYSEARKREKEVKKFSKIKKLLLMSDKVVENS